MTKRNCTCVEYTTQPKTTNRKLSTADFVAISIAKHGDKYCYKNSDYKGARKKVEVFCKYCNTHFWQDASTHMNKCGCPACAIRINSGKRIKSQKSVVEDFIKAHGGRYSYDKVRYTTSKDKVTITCREHGDFKQSVAAHYKGHGCPKCAGVGRKTQDEAIADFIKAHGNRYDYSLVDYKSVDGKVKIICKVHGVFEQIAYAHSMGTHCHACAIVEHPNLQYKDNAEVIAKFVSIHGETYDYSKVEYQGAFTPVIITCFEHGDFSQAPHSHNGGSGCPECAIKSRFRYTRSSYIKNCKRNNNGQSSLYVISLKSNKEAFYKIGITKRTVKERFRKLKDYTYSDIFLIHGDAGFIFDLESRLHNILKSFRYEPKIHFDGHTECFTHITKPVEKLLKQLESTEQLQLLA